MARAQTPSPDLSKLTATPYSLQNGGVPAPVRVERVGPALKMTSTAGGSLGVKLDVPPFDLDQLTRLSFDYTVTPDAKINFFFRVNGNYYAVLFTGPKKVRAGTPIVYDTHATKMSGHIEIPLRAAIRSQTSEPSLRLDEILAGNWDNDGYMMAGIGGNGPGASWTISNLKIDKPDAKPTFGAARFEADELLVPARGLDSLSFKDLKFKTPLGEANAVYDPLREAFVYDANTAFRKAIAPESLALRDGQNVDYSLRGEGGQTLSEGKAPFRFGGLPVPSPPRLNLSAPADNYPRVDFEDDDVPFGLNRPRYPNTVFSRDSDNPYNGHWSALFTNPKTASPFDAPAGQDTLDVATHPVLTFAYKCDDRLRVDLNFSWNNQPYKIHFTDSDNPNAQLADVGAIRDGQWHVAQIDVLKNMKEKQPNATEFKISNLMWSDYGWPGNVKGLRWWLDDLKWAPKTDGKLEGAVMLEDATGTSAISYALDQTPATTVDDKPEGGPKLSLDLSGKTGVWWLHVRAQNGAGKWSETAHYPLWCG